MRRRGAAILLAILAAVTAPGVARANTVTIELSRAYAVPARACQSLPGAVSVWQVASDLALRGMTASELVVPSLTSQSAETCDPLGTHLSWDDLAVLRGDGWEAYPRGDGDPDYAADSCGLLPTFAAEGWPSASLYYAARDNVFSPGLEATAEGCFHSLRIVSQLAENTDPAAGPFLYVHELKGGGVAHYSSVAKTVAFLRRSPAVVLQAYRFVSGAGSVGHVSWDCLAGDAHWTSMDELYCYNDFLAVLDGAGESVVPVSSLVG